MSETMEVKAGRELDAEVAEKVMGVPATWRTVRRSAVAGGDYRMLIGVPHYSTSILPAWEIVEWFAANHDPDAGARWQLDDAGPNVRAAFWSDAGDMWHYAEAATAPLAICLAALSATRTTGEQP